MKTFKILLSIILAVVVVVVVGGFLGGIKVLQFQAMAEAPVPSEAQTVSVASVEESTWESVLRSVGSVAAVEGIRVRTEVGGVIESIEFRPGAHVEAGDVLIRLDQSIEEANLHQAQATLDLARRTLRRTKDLFETRSIPEAEFDVAQSRVVEAEAQVAAIQAELEKRTVRAPFPGRLGIKQISVGQYLDPGDQVVVLQSVSPIYVEFSLPQRNLGQIEEGYPVRVRTDAYEDQIFTGEITAINPGVDELTRTVRVQATFANPGGQLRPGMFARVGVVLPEKRDIRVIPSTAVVYAPYGDSVYVVEGTGDELTARQQFVRLGEARGDFVEIIEGLSNNERIVGTGAFKLRQGMPIRISDVGTAEPRLHPTPADS